MGWDYINATAYGITVNSRKSIVLKDLLTKYSNVLDWSEQMSEGSIGSIFVFIKSSYKSSSDSGTYALRMPDTTGTLFDPPKHPIIEPHRLENESSPNMTREEWEGMNAIMTECVLLKEVNTFNWVNCAYISY